MTAWRIGGRLPLHKWRNIARFFEASVDRRKLYKKICVKYAFFLIILLILLFVLPKMCAFFAPFIFSFIVAVVLNPFVSYVTKKTRVPRRAAAFAAVFFGFLLLAGLLIWFIYKFLSETAALGGDVTNLTDYYTRSFDIIVDRARFVLNYLPGDTEAALDGAKATIADYTRKITGDAVNIILNNAKSTTIRIGNLLFSVVIFVISAYFMTANYEIWRLALIKKREALFLNRLFTLFSVVKSAFGGFFKAQLVLSFFTFVIMFAALTATRQNYVFIISVATAVADFLPVIGPSILLMPWALIAFFGGDFSKTMFLISLSLVIFIARKLTEPKVLSASIGISPFLAFFSSYVGLKTSGLLGLILAPVVAVVIINLIKSDIFFGIKNDFARLRATFANEFKQEQF